MARAKNDTPTPDLPTGPEAGDSNTGGGITITTRYHEPMVQYVWDVSYTIDGKPYTDSSFRTGAEAEEHAALIRDSYGDRLK